MARILSLLDVQPGIQVLLYLLRRCYGLIYRLLSSSEPVSEELMPIVRLNLAHLPRLTYSSCRQTSSPRSRNVSTKYTNTAGHLVRAISTQYALRVYHATYPNEYQKYQLALHQIDSMRKDGKFVGHDGSVPEGQGIVMAHLNECHELLEMVRTHLLSI